MSKTSYETVFEKPWRGFDIKADKVRETAKTCQEKKRLADRSRRKIIFDNVRRKKNFAQNFVLKIEPIVVQSQTSCFLFKFKSYELEILLQFRFTYQLFRSKTTFFER